MKTCNVCAVCRWIDLHGTDETGRLMAFMPRKSFVSVGARLQQSSPVFVGCSRGEERGGCIWGEARGESSVRCLLKHIFATYRARDLVFRGVNPPR